MDGATLEKWRPRRWLGLSILVLRDVTSEHRGIGRQIQFTHLMYLPLNLQPQDNVGFTFPHESLIRGTNILSVWMYIIGLRN